MAGFLLDTDCSPAYVKAIILSVRAKVPADTQALIDEVIDTINRM